MHPVDHRKLAMRVYSFFPSLRKTARVLQVSHTTVWRWLKNPERAAYPANRRGSFKTVRVISTLKASIQANPFVSLNDLKSIVLDVLGFTASRELLRTVICKAGYSKKKARFFSQPSDLEAKTRCFLERRNNLLRQNRPFVAMDETSFGRHGALTKGYSPIGQALVFPRARPWVRTTSCLAAVSNDQIIHRVQTVGSFNADKFMGFLETLDLPCGTVVLLDNVSFHHCSRVKEYASLKGWELLYTPPYSPWFNPIEGVFSIVKRSFYTHGCIEKAFASVKPSHLQAFFTASLMASSNPLGSPA